MVSLDALAQADAAATVESSDRWEMSCYQFLAALTDGQRPVVEKLLHARHSSGSGLREWVSTIAWRGGLCPEHVPAKLIEVYLSDSEALPLHDCEDCGLAIPVRPSRLHGLEAEPEQLYFEVCPSCGGRTGWYRYWARRAEVAPIDAAITRRVAR